MTRRFVTLGASTRRAASRVNSPLGSVYTGPTQYLDALIFGWACVNVAMDIFKSLLPCRHIFSDPVNLPGPSYTYYALYGPWAKMSLTTLV